MVAPLISISSDSSEESVGSCAPRVILFGVILAIILVILEIPIVPVDPLVAPDMGANLPLVSSFLCSDDSEADGKSEPAEQRPYRHSMILLHHHQSFPLPLLLPHPGFIDGQRLLSDPVRLSLSVDFTAHILTGRVSCSLRGRELDPFLLVDLHGDMYLIIHRIVILHQAYLLLIHLQVIPYPDIHHQTPPMLIHLPPQRFVHRSHDRTPRRSEAFRRWRSTPLYTPYPPTTSESSLGSSSERSLDSSSPSSRPSRKRCRSPTTSVPSPTHDSRSIAPTPADLLPPRKRFRDSYSPEDSREEHMEVDTADAEAIADVGISDGVAAHTEDSVGMIVEIAASDVRANDEEFEAEASTADTREIVVDPLAIGDSCESSKGGIPDLEDTIYDIVHYMSEVRIDRITEIKTTQRQLEASQLVASGERASLVERIGWLRPEYLKVRAMLSIERDRIDSLRWHMALSQEEFCQVRRDRDDTQRRLRRLESYVERHLGFHP
ncbi:hypothetical protein Tco_0313672 [Tanacetum coccineum]